ncbi:MAG TPA: hypothetical protein VMU30_08165 [Bacteroidota bacterium]|nr:hypothetical protein [Bacteroidota bacterium]
MKVQCFFLCVCISLASVTLFAQTEQTVLRAAKGQQGIDPNSLVSFKSDVPYNKAIQSLGELSKSLEGKILIDHSPTKGSDKQIGVNIESMYWKDALELILRSNQLWYNDNPDYLEIVSIEDLNKQSASVTNKAEIKTPVQQTPPTKELAQPGLPLQLPVAPVQPKDVDSSEYFSKIREITISSIFFEVDTKKLSESGIDFSFVRGNNLNLGVNLNGAEQMVNQFTVQSGANQGLKENFYSVSANPTGLTVDVGTMLAVFESNQIGEIISRPQVTVRSGSSSMIQIGQDISVLEKDFSGNTVTKFYPTGTILNVHPKLYRINNVDFIDLRYSVEKSSATTGATSTTIDKTKVDGSLTLLNGEEGYIGGLYDNEVTTVRNGVPFLKDLPWWVFGLRYIFGYNSESVSKKELIVLMKAELVPLIEERAAQHVTKKDVIQERRDDIQRDINKHSKMK